MMFGDAKGRALRGSIGALVAASVGTLLYRQSRLRNSPGRAAQSVGGVLRVISVGRSKAELYAAWLDLLPQTMEPLAQVTKISDSTVRWVLAEPVSRTFETIIERTRPGEVLTWTNADAGGPPFSGAIKLRAAPRDEGTEVFLSCHTTLPAAIAGAAAMTALQRFKSLIETGELPSLEGNPSGRKADWAKVENA